MANMDSNPLGSRHRQMGQYVYHLHPARRPCLHASEALEGEETDIYRLRNLALEWRTDVRQT
jgi:hypothetical protein